MPGNPFRSRNKARMGSISRTNQNQGGGEKKAGLPPTMALTQQRNLAFRHRHPILLPMSVLIKTANPNVNPTRPIGSIPKNYVTRHFVL
jgi:hypothetical protein